MKNNILKILTEFNSETILVRNRNWVAEKETELKTLVCNDYFMIEFLYKYGDFNDIYFYSFDNEKEMNNFILNEKTTTDNDKWFSKQFYSNGFENSLNQDL